MASPQSTVSGYELNLEEYWQVLRRRRWVILFCAFSLGVFSWLFSWVNQPPPQYRSTASVKVERSTSMTGLMMQELSFSNIDDMRTQVSLIESYVLMERVAQRLGMVPKNLSNEEIRANPDYMEKILRLKDAISAEQEGASGVININAVSSNPEFARDLAQATAESFRAYNIEEKNRRVLDAKRFIQQQLVVVGKRLKEAEEAVRAFRKQHNIVVGDQDSNLMNTEISDLEAQYRKAASHLNDLHFALSQLRQMLKRGGWDYHAITVSGKVSSYFDELNKRLVDMAIKHTELSTNYTEAHPQIKELRSQADDILKNMVGELDKQVGLTKQRMREYQQTIEEKEKRYQGMSENTLDFQRLQRAVKINEDLENLLEKKHQEVLIKEAEKVEEVTLIRPALVPHIRINPVRTGQTAMAGLILGLVLGLLIALVLEAMDTSVGTIEEVESFLEVPVVGFVPYLSHEEAAELFSGMKGMATTGYELERQMRLIAHFSPPSMIAEAFRSMRTSLMFSPGGKQHEVIMVTSSTGKEGKSTVAANLAVVVAQQGARVLLVDADMRKPMQHKTFGLKSEPGLREYLLGQLPWQNAVRRISDLMLGEMGVDSVMRTPGLDQLDIITSGRTAMNATDLLAAPAMEDLLREARKEYDMVILDISPMLHTADATILASKVDGVLLVYRIGAVVRGALKRVKTNLESVGGNVLGIALNGVHGEFSSDYSKYKMNRYYAYGMDEEKETGLMARISKEGGSLMQEVHKGAKRVWQRLSRVKTHGERPEDESR
ncbi:MAG TPA: AAA family ATPase [Mariprofundaceae bacterium]|nr:AAA family ATPase [Mariprofundaceae bacterium]